MLLGGTIRVQETKRTSLFLIRVMDIIVPSQYICGCGDKTDPRQCQIVNAKTKAYIPNRESSVIFVINYATLNNDKDESESLTVPFEMMQHGIAVNLTPTTLGGSSKMYVD
eukprot:10519078-Ditylum_brightwellii.AAC.1